MIALMTIGSDYSANVRAEVARAGRTQANVRRAVNISAPAWTRRMRKPSMWKTGELQAIARELDVPLARLIGDEK